jgi:hypothetical protein
MSNLMTIDDLLSLPDAEEITREVYLPNGKTVLVRALSLEEHRLIANESQRNGQVDEARWHALLLHYGMKEPSLTYDQAQALARKPAGLVSEIVMAILDISGLSASGGISANAVEQDEELFRQG